MRAARATGLQVCASMRGKMPWTLFWVALALPVCGAKRVSKKDASSVASLMRLADTGDHITLERHLRAGASASALDREGTLLTHAAAAGHTEAIAVVLKYGGTDRATIDRQVRTLVSASVFHLKSTSTKSNWRCRTRRSAAAPDRPR